jgi:EAL domain-containing protein (putative c-di-GMP-specific phosphodiesterase class I)/GGDEF domain-containing protein
VSSVESNRKSVNFRDIVSFILEELEEETLLICFDPKEVSFINKVYGYEIGDKVFSVIEKELKRELPADSGILRCPVGTVCLISPDKALEVEKTFEKINSRLRSEFKYLPVKLSVSAFSILFPKNPEIEVDEAVSLIDYAWKEAKKSERPLKFNIEELKEKMLYIKIKESVETLISFLEKGNFKIAAQGIYNLKSGQLEHYELLFRAIDGSGRIIPAGEIIDLIYEYRLVHKLDLAVLKKIVENRNRLPKGKIFINLSTSTLKFPSTREKLLSYFRTLKESGIRFGIEITEQKILEDEAVLKDFFNSIDIPISIDDFGSGYASFSQFISLSSNLPVKFLKIDGSYVKLLSSEREEEVKKAVAVVKSINSMAHSLGMETIAEFVENEKILEKLKELKVDYGQGYYLGKPEIVF